MKTTAGIDNPDFAYPKTVSANAKAAMAKINVTKPLTEAQQDLYLDLRLQYDTGQALIDPANMPKVIASLSKTIPTVADASLRSMLRVLLAQYYSNYYNRDRWRFDRRELPAEPRLADISEWSGEMFKSRIAEIAREAFDEAKGDATPITAFRRSVTVPSKLSGLCYPTVADFVAARTVEMCDGCGNDSVADGIAGKYAPALSPRSAPSLAWQVRNVIGDKDGGDTFKALKALYEANLKSPYAPIVLLSMVDYSSGVNEEDYTDAPAETATAGAAKEPDNVFVARRIEETLAAGADEVLVPKLREALKHLCSPSATLSFPSVCSGAEVKVKVAVKSANKVEVLVYKVSDEAARDYNKLKQLVKSPALLIQRLSFSGKAPFEAEDSLTVQLPDYGYYAIVPKVAGKKSGFYPGDLVRRVPVLTLGLSNIDFPGVIVVNSSTGAPEAGASVTAWYNEKNIGNYLTDSLGFTHFGPGGNQVSNVIVKSGGRSYRFDDYLYRAGDYGTTGSTLRAQVLTDRALYHPGDKVNFVAVLSSDSVPTLREGVKAQMVLFNSNYQRIDTIDGASDSFGRISGNFTLPKDGLTGMFRIETVVNGRNRGSAAFTVSDYKMPQFEIADLTTSRDVPEKGSVTISGRVVTYSGMPVAGAKVTASLYPISYWRFWENEAMTASFDVESDADGRFKAVFTPEMKEGTKSDFFRAQFSALSQAGERVEGSKAFTFGKPYAVSLRFSGTDIDGEKPFTVPCAVVDPDGNEQKGVALTWKLTSNDKTEVAGGSLDGPLDLSKIRPGKYTLSVAPADSLMADPAKTEVLVYNVRSGVVPTEALLWCPVSRIEDFGDGRRVLVATTAEKEWVYVAVNIGDRLHSLKCHELAPGYHYLDLGLPDSCRSAEVKMFTVSDCKTENHDIAVLIPEKRGLKITAESMRERLTPASTETWKFRITDLDGKPVSSALVLDLYNKALDALAPHDISLSLGRAPEPNRLSLRLPGLYTKSTQTMMYSPFDWSAVVPSPEFKYINNVEEEFIVYGYATGRRMKYRSANKLAAPMAEYAAADEVKKSVQPTQIESAEEEMADAGSSDSGSGESFSFRDADVPLAVWAPMLTTDDDGCLTFSFTVPNAVTTWRLLSVAFDRTGAVGDMVREFIANKPLMVQPLMPRFLRQGDTAEVNATVYNNSDEALSPEVTFELFNPLTGEAIAAESRSIALEAGAQGIVSFPLSTLTPGLDALSAVGVRVKAQGGDFADGEVTVLPLLSSMAQLVETEPFYLNPGQEEYSASLPKGDDARLTLTYCNNPAWTVVSALPGLREQFDYANSASAALFSASVARGLLKDNPRMARVLKEWAETPGDSALVSNLEKNEDLKIALLSATPWVVNAMNDTDRMERLRLIFDKVNTDKAVSDAMATLKKLQRADGGFSWGSWGDRSSYWVTMSVLEMMGDLNRFGWLPSCDGLTPMLKKALRYADKTTDKTDLLYAAVRPQLASLEPVSANGQKVIKATVGDILAHWKTYSPSTKAIAATALSLNGYRTKAREVLSSLEQFGVSSPSQGVTFPSVGSLAAYGCILEAFATISPDSPMVDGLRQQLIVRKQATDWGSAVVTSQVVAGILSCGTKWTASSSEAVISAGGKELKPGNTPSAALGDIRIDLSPYAGENLKITRTADALTGPAYGAVYAQFRQEMSEVKTSPCDDLSIEKRLYRRAGTGWENADSLRVGDRVKVSLVIVTKRNLQYVSLIDERPASFAPAEQLPGWIYSDGAAFYRENRDAVTNLSIDSLRPGTYILEYEMNVQHAGRYSSGVASIQSQYAPEISAHSAGTCLTVTAE